MGTSLRIDNMNEFIDSIIKEFSEFNFTFREIDEVLFFVDLDFKDFLVEELNKQNQFSKELVRDLVLISRKIDSSTIEHFHFIQGK